MTRPILAAFLLTAVIAGGFFVGVIRGVTDTGVDW